MKSPTWKLSEQAMVRYRALRYDENAPCCVSYIPINGIYWPDEHPEGSSIPEDDESTVAILQLLAARKQLWHTGQIPPELQTIWDEARALLPDWPGFYRLSLTAEQKDIDLAAEETSDEIWKALSLLADETTESQDETGWVSSTSATWDLRKKEEP